MKYLLFANTDWYLYNFRLSLAQAIRAQGHAVTLVSPPGEYAERLQQAGFRWIPFSFSRKGTNPFTEVDTIARLIRLYRSEAPDLAHHFTVKCVLYGSIAARLTGVPAVVNAVPGLGYVFNEGGKRNPLLYWMVKILYRFALGRSLVIFQNPDDRQLFLKNHLVVEERSYLIRGSGVDAQRFQPSEEADGLPVVLLPSRLLWDKGVGEFVEAARLLHRRGVAARFVLVGDSDAGNPSSVSGQQLAEWQAEGAVEWWGWRDDMERVYPQAAVVCLPSYHEGVPRCLIEAAACARPLVATDVPGCREIVVNGENGLLVPVRDSAALAAALETLLSDKELRRKMGERSRQIMLQGFSVEQVTLETMKVYQRAAAGRSV